jgi:molecular chaperone Hsp33
VRTADAGRRPAPARRAASYVARPTVQDATQKDRIRNDDTRITGQDTLQKFIFDNAAVRGELVEISATWREIQSRHNYPAAGQKTAGRNGGGRRAAVGQPEIQRLDRDADPRRRPGAPAGGRVRRRPAPARHRQAGDPDASVADDAKLTELLNATGKGRFVITLDPLDKMPGQQPYQGIVPLDGESVATVIENYMLRSEQLDTKLWLAADDKVSRGLLLQKLPRHSGNRPAPGR